MTYLVSYAILDAKGRVERLVAFTRVDSKETAQAHKRALQSFGYHAMVSR